MLIASLLDATSTCSVSNALTRYYALFNSSQPLWGNNISDILLRSTINLTFGHRLFYEEKGLSMCL